MTPQEKEAYYDAEIAPVLLELATKCHERRIPFIAVVEWDPSRPHDEGWGKTIGGVTPSELCAPVKRVYAAATSSGVEAFAITVTKP